MSIKLLVLAGAIALASGAAHAQNSTVTGAAGGAVTGAVVGGPIGAAVGGVVGAVAGTVISPPPERVVTYVRQAPQPVERVVVQERIVVGEPIPETVVVTQIPEDPTYAYAWVNGQRVIVEPSSGTVVQIID